MAQLELNIHKRLCSGQRVFDLHVALASDSQRIVILGASGSGKSLLLKSLAGLSRPDQGVIRLGGRTLFDTSNGIDLSPQQRQVGYVFQDYALFPHLNVRQNVASALTRGWLNPRRWQRREVVEHWLRIFHLEHLAHQLPGEISGGQRQRTALARALVAAPRALLLDEPFAALDPELRGRMRQELDSLQSQLGIPMILITHDPEDAQVFGEHVLRLQDGNLMP